MATRILAIHAHPDDIEFQCAGVLWLLKERGCPITLATMTPGDKGSAELGPEAISETRRHEARKSAELLGADYFCLEFRDLEITFDVRSRRRVTEFIRDARPEVIFTAPPVDYMADHEITSQLVRDAAFAAATPNYQTEELNPAPCLHHLPHLYYVDPTQGVDYFGQPTPPGQLVDVTSVFEHKRAMLACHESQRAWLLRQHAIDEYLDAQERWSAQRGKLLGTRYAEAFRQHTGHPFPTDDILSRLLQTV